MLRELACLARQATPPHSTSMVQAVDAPPVTELSVEFELDGQPMTVTLSKVSPSDRWCQALLSSSSSGTASTSDLVPGEYEGGFKLWEGALDLLMVLASRVHGVQRPVPDECVARLSSDISCSGQGQTVQSTGSQAAAEHSKIAPLLVGAVQSMLRKAQGQRVLELGCGHGLPGIFMLLAGAHVTFHVRPVQHLDRSHIAMHCGFLPTATCAELVTEWMCLLKQCNFPLLCGHELKQYILTV